MDDTRYRIQASWTERRKNLEHITTHHMAIRPKVFPPGSDKVTVQSVADRLYAEKTRDEFASDVAVDVLEETVTLDDKGYVDQVGICRMVYSSGVGDIMDPREGVALARRVAAEHVEGKDLPPQVEGLATAGDSTQQF